tara:strand:+ start:163 stop:459 length:297 start_codon:yes stop_codon:yes gene_type:complete
MLTIISREELKQLELRVSDILNDKGKVLSVESGGGCQWDVKMQIPKKTVLGSVWSWGKEIDLHVGGWSINSEKCDVDNYNLIVISFICGEHDCDWCCD